MEQRSRRAIKSALKNYLKNFDNVVQSTVDWAENNMAVDYGKVVVKSSKGNYKETQLCGLIDENQKKCAGAIW